jgi:hypothetical protein
MKSEKIKLYEAERCNSDDLFCLMIRRERVRMSREGQFWFAPEVLICFALTVK